MLGGRLLVSSRTWVSARPGLTLDRIDNEGSYEPGNCRWTDTTTQTRNMRRNIWVVFRDERMCLLMPVEQQVSYVRVLSGK